MSKAFTNEETAPLPVVLPRPPPLTPRPLDDETRARLNADGAARQGATVVLLEGHKRLEYRLVAPDEADPATGRLSVDSPLGRAILNKRAGDEVRFVRPRGAVDLELRSVRY